MYNQNLNLKNQTKSYLYDREKLILLSNMTMDNFELFMDELNFKMYKVGRMYRGICPIHQNADNPTACNIKCNKDDPYYGTFACWTHLCHEKYKSTILGFIRGILSNVNSCEVSFYDTIKYIESKLKINHNTFKIDEDVLEKRNFINQITSFENNGHTQDSKITREIIRNRLIIPPQYYLDQKFSAELLDEYDIGLCINKQKPTMNNRIVVPIYDDDGKFMLGCTGRSIFEVCDSCKYYHDGNCPQTDYNKFIGSKWLHSKGFLKQNHLFNYWKAKSEIKKTKCAVLTEGPMDTLRLIDNGIKNVVAIFGTSLSDTQLAKLNKIGVLTLIIMLDNDEPGRIASKKIKEEYSNLYNLFFPSFISDDPGNLNSDIITDKIKPIIEYCRNENIYPAN